MNLRDLQGVESVGLDQLAFEGGKGGMGWKVLSEFGFGRLGGCMVCIHLFIQLLSSSLLDADIKVRSSF